MERIDFLKKSELISGFIAIIMELERSLDETNESEVVGNLARLYIYIRERAFEANMTNNPEILEEVANLLLTVKEGWDAIEDPDAAK